MSICIVYQSYMNKKCEFWTITNRESRILWPHPNPHGFA